MQNPLKYANGLDFAIVYNMSKINVPAFFFLKSLSMDASKLTLMWVVST